MTSVKICGVTTPAALIAARRGGAGHVGFVGKEGSPRFISPGECTALSQQADGLIRVGLFVDARDEEIRPYLGAIDVLQLHGNESPARAAELQGRFGRPVWKALGIRSARDLDAANAYRDVAELILFDAKPPEGAALTGGHGVRFDWSLLDGWPRRGAWGLAGGLTPANVGRAIAATGAPLVDVSSGVEEAPGEKSAAKIAAFMEAVKSL